MERPWKRGRRAVKPSGLGVLDFLTYNSSFFPTFNSLSPQPLLSFPFSFSRKRRFIPFTSPVPLPRSPRWFPFLFYRRSFLVLSSASSYIFLSEAEVCILDGIPSLWDEGGLKLFEWVGETLHTILCAHPSNSIPFPTCSVSSCCCFIGEIRT